MSLIHIENIIKNYETGELITKVLKGITLNIEEGEFVAIMGPSGSGKSTLMHILGFLDKPTGGTYVFEEENVEDLDEDELAEIRNKKAGFVFQAYNLLARTSALDNVCLPLVYAGVSQKKQQSWAQEALKRVGLEHRVHHKPNELSGGQQQRVAIARALINNPKVIFADEPTGNLDTKSSIDVMRLLQELNKQGKTIIMVTHEPEIAELTKRNIMLRDGLIVEDKTIQPKQL